jgi:hypothetical protein
MTYKIVKNSAGDVVAFGPNDEHYEPTIKDGETMIIESGETAENLIREYQAQQIAAISFS